MKTINIEQENHILKITLNRPEVHNAMNSEMIHELTQAFQEANEKPTARVVLLSANGASFCAGADLTDMKAAVDFTEQENIKDSENLYGMFYAIKYCKLPVVAKLHGNIMGGGLGLAAAADISIAESGAIFSFSEVRLGLIPAVISSFVSKKMSKVKMTQLMLTAERFDADKAVHSGLITEVGRELEIKERLQKILEEFSKLGPSAVIKTKQLLLDLESLPEKDVRSYTTQLIASQRVTTEGQEGLKAFFEKRKANWIFNPQIEKSVEK